MDTGGEMFVYRI